MKRGISLIALVVTIVILLILAGVTIALTMGSGGVVERAQNSKIESRYATIMDKIKIRETDMEIAAERGESSESRQDFINRLVEEGLITEDDSYDDENGTIYIGKQDDDVYKYIIPIVDPDINPPTIDPEDVLPDADIPGNEYLKNMTLIIRTTSANQTVMLPISRTPGLTINWDAQANPNNFQNPNLATDPTHTYSQSGEYEVQIKGESMQDTDFGEVWGHHYNPNIIGIKYWGENGFDKIGNLGENIEREIPLPSINSFKNVTEFSGTFVDSSITSIPAELFANCPKITSIYHTFFGCENIKSIPGELFVNCPNVTNFGSAFYACYSIKSIPAELFANCPNVTSFDGTFVGCIGLTSIPSTLFDNCLKVTSFDRTFSACVNLTGNAPDLWNRTGVNGNWCFKNCTGLANYDDIASGWK